MLLPQVWCCSGRKLQQIQPYLWITIFPFVMELIPYARLPCDPRCWLTCCSSSFYCTALMKYTDLSPMGTQSKWCNPNTKGRWKTTLLPKATQKEEREMAYVPQDFPLRDWKEPHLWGLWAILINREHQAKLICHRPHTVLVPAESICNPPVHGDVRRFINEIRTSKCSPQ